MCSILTGRILTCVFFLFYQHEDPMVEQPGAFGIDIEDGSLFTVVGYDSNPELTYLCFQAHKATLYHNG